MVQKIFITFGNEKYYGALDRLKKQAEAMKVFNQVFICSDQTLKNDTEFWKKHGKFITSNSRGYGFWIWKSYLILQTLKTMNDNDILVYADAGCALNPWGKDRLHEYFDMINNSEYGMLSFQMHHHKEKTWCKMDLANYLEMNNPEALETGQIIGGVQVMRKCPHVMNIVTKWYETACDYHLIDNSPSKAPNDNTFREHRHDQAVISLLCKKYGSIKITDETFFENFMCPEAMKIPILATRNSK